MSCEGIYGEIAPKKNDDIKFKLVDMGIQPHFKGFQYIIDSLEFMDTHIPTGEIIQKVADKNNATFKGVERSLRTVIMKSDYKYGTSRFLWSLKLGVI